MRPQVVEYRVVVAFRSAQLTELRQTIHDNRNALGHSRLLGKLLCLAFNLPDIHFVSDNIGCGRLQDVPALTKEFLRQEATNGGLPNAWLAHNQQ